MAVVRVQPNMFPNTGAANHATANRLNQSLKPEWLRVPDAVRIFGISRSALYELIAGGEIKSTALKKRGAVRGIRIISFDSLADYCERAASNTEQERTQMEGGDE